MKLTLTERPRISDLKKAIAVGFTAALADLDIDRTTIGREIDDVKGGIVGRWGRDESNHPLPVWVLASRAAVSDALFERIVSDLRDLRAQQARPNASTSLGLAFAFMRAAGEALTAIATASADLRIDAHERQPVRTPVSSAVEIGQRLVASLHADDERDSQPPAAPVVPMRGTK